MTKATKSTPKAKPQAKAPAIAAARMAPTGKISVLIGLLERPSGATTADLMAATGWQAPSVRGAIAGSIKKTLGRSVLSEKTEVGRVYRIVADSAA